MLYQEQAQDLYVEGNRRMAADDAAGAEALYLQALELDPLHGAARGNLAYVRQQQGAYAEAELHFRLALAALPGNAQLHQNLGVLLLKQKRLAEAEAVLREAVALAPESPAAWRHLGVALACAQRDQEAEAVYRQALSLSADPEGAEAARTRFNLAYVLLRNGRWTEGWPLLESRWRFDQLPQWFDCPRWQGERLAGKSLAIGLEAGQGDMIQFCRYAALAKAQGAARIGVVCHPALKTLFSTMAGIDAAWAYDEAVPAQGWDYWTLPMSMPRWFGTTPDDVPASVPYLHADPAAAARWSGRLPQSGLRIGLAWKGNPQFENDADRSLSSLGELAPLWRAGAAGGVHFISLQKGPGEDEAASPPSGVMLHHIAPQLRDFADTAAVIANLDLVISIDSAVAHLAGAMGKPCWLLLPDYRCDWRWLTQRADTPWYPNTRLFRQTQGWPAAIAAVATELAQLAGVTA